MKRLFIRFLCGGPKQQGNVSIWYEDGTNDVFQVGLIRALILDWIFWKSENNPMWASHPITRAVLEYAGKFSKAEDSTQQEK